MCAIVDSDVAAEVFGKNPSDAGLRFFNWVSSGTGLLIVGGKNLIELNQTSAKTWISQAYRFGKVRIEDKQEVNNLSEEISTQHTCKSNDQHILALSRISGARLLFTNDWDLQKDFKNGLLVGGKGGKIYTTRKNRKFGDTHKRLLKRHVCENSS